jgi:hypothetical protein
VNPDQLARTIAATLAAKYVYDRSAMARICDEQIDRSGALLGWLREYVTKTTASQGPTGNERD